MRYAQISFPAFGITVNPSASFNVFGLTLYYYGAIIASGLMIAILYGSRRSESFGIKQDDLFDILLFAIPMSIIGARLYYVVFSFNDYKDDLLSIFNIREGGLAIYGTVIAAIITVIVVCRHKKIPAGAMLDLGSLGLLIGQSIGRWGNFINREAFGSTTEVFCRMGLTISGTETIYVHPTFLYESLWNALGFLILHVYSTRWRRRYDGELFLMYIAWYGLGRMFIEGLRTDSLYIPGTAIRASQALAAASMLVALLLLATHRLWRRGQNTLFADQLAEEKSAEGGKDFN